MGLSRIPSATGLRIAPLSNSLAQAAAAAAGCEDFPGAGQQSVGGRRDDAKFKRGGFVDGGRSR